MERNKANQEAKWLQFDYYQNFEDWNKALEHVKKHAQKLKSFQGKLDHFEAFATFNKTELKLNAELARLMQFLRYGDVDKSNAQYLELETKLNAVLSEIQVDLSFLPSELKKIGAQKITKFLEQDSSLAVFKYSYRSFFKQAKHILPADQEQLLSKVSRSRNCGSTLYEMLLYADRKKVMVNYDDKKQELTPTLLKTIMETTEPLKDQQLRFEMQQKDSAFIREHSFTLAKIYEQIVLNNVENAKIHKYESPLHVAMEGDHVSPTFYHNLLSLGVKANEAQKRFIALKKNHFKNKHHLKKFKRTDNRLLLVKQNQETIYTVEEAKTVITNALKLLGSEYQEFLNKAWAPHRIDYYFDTNKRSGAYSVGAGRLDPQILMNWDDSLRSVSTLAHEIGHSVHTYFSNKYQKAPLNEYPILQAEVASTLNEHFLFDYVLEKSTKTIEKVNLIQQRIQDLCGTFFRQLHFADFELQAHDLAQKNVPLSRDCLQTLFSKLAVKHGISGFDDDAKPYHYSWPYILHFFESPFYVYKYAASLLASFAFYSSIKANGQVTPYLDFLKAGGCKEPLTIFKEAGIDFSNDELYKTLIAYLNDLLDKFEALIKKL